VSWVIGIDPDLTPLLSARIGIMNHVDLPTGCSRRGLPQGRRGRERTRLAQRVDDPVALGPGNHQRRAQRDSDCGSAARSEGRRLISLNDSSHLYTRTGRGKQMLNASFRTSNAQSRRATQCPAKASPAGASNMTETGCAARAYCPVCVTPSALPRAPRQSPRPSRRSHRGESTVRTRLPAGGRWIRTCMGLFLSSSRFWFFAGSLFGAGKPFFVPSPAIRFAERAEGVKGPKR
jgi:hypothetical protein